VEIAQDTVAGPDDGCGFMIDEDPECVAIAGQNSLDNGAFIDDLGVCGRDWKR
jgi:hypothetical protein